MHIWETAALPSSPRSLDWTSDGVLGTWQLLAERGAGLSLQTHQQFPLKRRCGGQTDAKSIQCSIGGHWEK